MTKQNVESEEAWVRPVVMIDINLIDNADYNPQEQDKVVFNRMVKSIKENGFGGTIQVVPHPTQKKRYVCISGNHRLDAARVLDIKELPCNVYEDWDEDKQKAENVSWNVIHGKFNPEKLAKLFNELSQKYGDELAQDMMALEADSGLIKQIMAQIRQGLPPDMQGQLDKSKDEIKTVDQLSAILNEMFDKHGDDLKYGFMVFEFGGKSHYWIKMNDKLKKKMQEFTDECRETGGHLSERIYAAMGCGEIEVKKREKGENSPD